MEIFRERRSVRYFTDAPIAPEVIDYMKEVLLLAPSAMNLQSCKFKFVADKQLIYQLVHARENYPYIGYCQLIVVVCKDKSIQSLAQVEDASIAAAHLQLFCVTQKLGSCWIHLNARTTDYGGSSSELVSKICQLPEHLDPHCMLIIGHPAQKIVYKPVDVDGSRRII